jgi:hypothetical protein
MSDGMSELIELKKTYDYIILDATSGTGFWCFGIQYSDVTLYIVGKTSQNDYFVK